MVEQREGGDGIEIRCPECESWFRSITVHWAKSECTSPRLSQEKLETLKGMMLGDGTLEVHSDNAKVRVAMINKTFLEWFDDCMGWITNGVRLNKTAREQAASDYSVDNEIDERNCHDYYRVSTYSHRSLNRFKEWYGDDGIVFPESIELTPIALKMWYLSDGNLKWDTNSCVEISSVNESSRPHVVESLFSNIGFDVTNVGKMFRLKTSQTKDFFEYIGGPVPGFEYKWCFKDQTRYKTEMKRMKNVHCTQTLD